MSDKIHKVIIIGSGPAGWTAALYTSRANLEPLVFEGNIDKGHLPGGQLMTTTEVENFPGYPEGVDGYQMMQDFQKQAEKFGTKTISQSITKVDLSKRPFTLWADDEKVYQTESLIIATGASAKYLGLEAEKTFMNKGVSACATCDGALPRFRNQPVVVIGGGDTAMEEANFLSRFASTVHIVHRRDKFRASPIMAQRTLQNPKIKVHWFSVVENIVGDNTGVTGVILKNVKTGETSPLPVTGYFSAIGHQPNTQLFTGVLDADETGYLITKAPTTATNIDGVFACGDVQDKIYRQAITAAGSGCAAALDCTRWLEAQEGH
eukprot:TRINITY_DN114_c0_g1_i1.p1 TRINITY_DN114_c0_g1~~TRINITY_DN114_c0_g1_i1.p1  ORF type:complete len:363 (-),score=93.49 TRINITY_DN114_c0_g1_i1:92-1054(-)